MREQPDLTEALETAINSTSNAMRTDFNRVDRIDQRRCASDQYDGVEYTIYGYHIPIRPIIDRMAKEEGFAIQNISHNTEGEPNLTIFVADLREQDRHPAFTAKR
jgi:hypothetical protein